MLRGKIREEYQSVQNQIIEMEEKLKKMPKGKLLFSRGKNSVKWYVSDGHKKVYLPKRDRHIAERLAEKGYLELKLQDLLQERQMIENYFDYYLDAQGVTDSTETLLRSDSNYRELLEPYFQLRDEELSRWMNDSYEKCEKYPENLIHKTSSGIYVRSKSESMIEMFLHTNQIPFRYECALELDGMTFYPDFTILHPKTREIYYWEHFGLMDDPDYVRNTCSKLELYARHGIIPSIQLITTYETKEHPLNYHDVARIGAQYFL